MPTYWLPYVPFAALVISVVALFVSGANLGWSIYKEVAFRARVRVWFGVRQIIGTGMAPLRRLVFSVTNVGPGVLRVQMIRYRKASLWKRITRRTEQGVIVHNPLDLISGRLPAKLEVGDGVDLLLPYEHDSLELGMTHIGITDSFGRTHWVSRKNVRTALQKFEKDFPKK